MVEQRADDKNEDVLMHALVPRTLSTWFIRRRGSRQQGGHMLCLLTRDLEVVSNRRSREGICPTTRQILAFFILLGFGGHKTRSLSLHRLARVTIILLVARQVSYGESEVALERRLADWISTLTHPLIGERI